MDALTVTAAKGLFDHSPAADLSGFENLTGLDPTRLFEYSDAKESVACTDFPALFQTYLLNGTEQALTQVRTQPNLVQDAAVRDNVLHMLTFALESPAAYAMARAMVQRLTPAMEQAGLWECWLPYLHKAIKQCQVHQDPMTEGYCYFWLGQLYQNQSKFPFAQHHWACAANLFAVVGDIPNQAKTLNRLAYLARLERRYADGTQIVADALRLLAPDDPERAFSYFVQGVIAFDQQAWSAAVAHFQTSLTLSEQQGDTVTIARRLRNLGPALRALGRYDEAIACYQRAIILFAEVYDPVQQAVTQMNLGVVYLLLEQPQPALESFQQAELVFRNAQDRLHLAMLYTNQGMAYRLAQRWDEAQASLEAAIVLWQQLGNVASQVNALDELALVYIAQRRVQPALCTLQQALDLLNQIEGDPAYVRHHRNLTKHVQQAQALPGSADIPVGNGNNCRQGCRRSQG